MKKVRLMVRYQTMREHLRSIPPLRTMPPHIRRGVENDVFRLPITIRVGRGGLVGPERAQQGETWVNGEQDWSKMVAEQTFKKPVREKPTTRAGLSGFEERISWEAEVMRNYDVQDHLGIFLQFRGISTPAPFMRGRRDYGPDTTLFYSPITHNRKTLLLLLSTCGDIFEAQVALAKDVDPVIFREEIYLPDLTTTYNPRSMAVIQRANLVIIDYQLT